MVSYEITLHPTARNEFENLDPEQQTTIKSDLESIATHEQITTHSKVRHLEGHSGFYRLRTGRLRAILTLAKPELRVLKIGVRRGMYQDIDAVLNERMEA